jgi:hypothetical protein
MAVMPAPEPPSSITISQAGLAVSNSISLASTIGWTVVEPLKLSAVGPSAAATAATPSSIEAASKALITTLMELFLPILSARSSYDFLSPVGPLALSTSATPGFYIGITSRTDNFVHTGNDP